MQPNLDGQRQQVLECGGNRQRPKNTILLEYLSRNKILLQYRATTGIVIYLYIFLYYFFTCQTSFSTIKWTEKSDFFFLVQKKFEFTTFFKKNSAAAFSSRLLPPQCKREGYSRSFLPTAIRHQHWRILRCTFKIHKLFSRAVFCG